MNLLVLFVSLIGLKGCVIHCQDLSLDMIASMVQQADQSISRSRNTAAILTRHAWTGLDHFNRRNKPRRNIELSIGGEVTNAATMMLKNHNPAWAASNAAKVLTPLDERAPVAGLSAAATMAFRRAAARTCMDSRPVIRCDPLQRYRETDGQCNNLYHRSYPSGAYKLGASFTAQGRFMYPEYGDGFSSPRISSVKNNHSLPNARLVSKKVHSGIAFKCDRHTPYLTHFGQFIDHDIVSTPEAKPNFTYPNSHCCLEPSLKECFNINFQTDDLLKGTCMRFTRADCAPSYFCNPGPRLQQNQRSSYIDGTMIYGWDDEKDAKLREKRSGRLISHGDNQLKLERLEDANNPPCKPVRNRCFEAGDHRPLETPTLTVIHIMFLRRHNLIVEELRKLPLPWTSELLYQEAKRIVVAELQHITYNEFLPRVLGPQVMMEHGLRPRKLYEDSYSKFVDPRTTSGFSVAAFRFGHSLVRNIHNQIGPAGSPINDLLLQDHFDRLETHLKPFPGGNTEGFARWMKIGRNSKADRTLVDGLQNNLFPCEDSDCPKGGGVTKAFDLSALNIQRGRDHGLPSYTKWRYWCSGKMTLSFRTNQLGLSDHSPFEAKILENTYEHVDDIDLFAGGLTEIRKEGTLVGPTFACIIAKQFSNYKRGDRYFYDRPDPVMAFSRGQLLAIKKTSLAKILCSTMKSFKSVQVNVMDTAGPKNPVIDCKSLARKDILSKIPRYWNKLPANAIRSATAKAGKKVNNKRNTFSSRRPVPIRLLPFFNEHLYGGMK